MALSEREQEVIRRMRMSDRAETAIYKYAVAFEGDKQAITTRTLTNRYDDAYDED